MSGKQLKKQQIDKARDALAMATNGSSCYWKIFPSDKAPVITDGVRAIVKICEAYWLVEYIWFAQFDKEISQKDFQVWRLVKEKNASLFTLYCEDGIGENCNKVRTEKIYFADFPLPEGITLWHTNGVILLPSED